jgi:hypothetical protein
MIYRSYYERKLFIFSISSILFRCQQQPENTTELLRQVIFMLIRQQRIEQNQKTKKEKPEETIGKRQAGNIIEKYGFDDVKEINSKKKKKKEKEPEDVEEKECEQYYQFGHEYRMLLD